MTTLFRAFFGGFFCWWCVKSSFAAFWKWVRQQMLLLVQVGEKLRASNCLLGSPSVRAELMAQTWLFALGICLWHTYSLLEHMLHACHSPRKRSGSETFTLTCSTFIAPMHQRVEVKKKKKKRSLGVQVGSLIVSYVLNFDDNVLARLVFGNSGCLLWFLSVLKASVEFCRERHMCLYIDWGLVQIPDSHWHSQLSSSK